MGTFSIKARLDKDTIMILRHKGGFHTSKKGKKGYDRKRNKCDLLKERAWSL